MAWVSTVPRRLRTAARFIAADPWQNGSRIEFSLEECLFLPSNVPLPARPGGGFLASGTVFFLRSDLDGSERLLPEAMVELWQTGKIAVERLPQLLFERPGKVRRRDAVPILHRKPIRWLPGLLALGVVGVAGFLAARSWLEAAYRAGTAGSTPAGLIVGILSVIAFFAGMIGLSIGLGLLIALPILTLRKRGRRREMASILSRLGVSHE